MAAHTPRPRRASGDTGPTDAVRRAETARSGRSSRARPYEPLSGQPTLPGLDRLQGPAPGSASRTASGPPPSAAHPNGRGTAPTPAPRRSAGSGSGPNEPGGSDQGSRGSTPVPEQCPHGPGAPGACGAHRYGGHRPGDPPGALVRRPSGDDGSSPAPAAPHAPEPESGPGARNGAPSGVPARFGRLHAHGRAPRRTERRCWGAGFRLPGRRRPRRGARCDTGMSTAEYALGTVSAVAFAGVLYVILTGGTVTEVLTDIVVDALSSGM